MSERRSIVYTLSSSLEPGLVRYVGMTMQALRTRLSGHISETKDDPPNTTHKCNWIRSVLASGGMIVPIPVATHLAHEEAYDLEQRIIAFYRAVRPKQLTNHTDGGPGSTGWEHTEGTKLRMSRSRRASPYHHSLEPDDVREVFRLRANGLTQKEIALVLKVTQQNVSMILAGQRWHSVWLEMGHEFGGETWWQGK